MCEKYENDATTFVHENEQEFPDPESARFDFFKNKFKIIDIGFRNDNDREKSEAFLIRTKRPTINDHFDRRFEIRNLKNKKSVLMCSSYLVENFFLVILRIFFYEKFSKKNRF